MIKVKRCPYCRKEITEGYRHRIFCTPVCAKRNWRRENIQKAREQDKRGNDKRRGKLKTA